MGVFDYVDVGADIDCPKCGKPVGRWQSKDGKCTLSLVTLTDVSNFYTVCDYCAEWIEYRRKPGSSTLDDFERVTL